MNDMKEQLLQWIAADKEQLVDFYAGFVRAKSPNPPGDTQAALTHVGAFLDRMKLPYRVVAPQAHMPNIVASFEGTRPGNHLVLNGHADVFPVGREDLWERDPWSGTVEDGRIYGRGSSDMKGGSTAAIFAYAYLSRLKSQLPGRLTLTIVSDEETGGAWGSGYLLEHFGDEVLGDCVLSGEPGGVGTVRYGEKGILQFSVNVKTRGAHGPYPNLSANAIRVASSIMDQLERLQDIEAKPPKSVADNLSSPLTRQVIETTMGAGSAELMRHLTVNVGTIRGGDKINMVAADCTMEVDIRVPIGIDRDDILARARTIVAAHEGATIDHVVGGASNHSDPEHAMAQIIRANASVVGLPQLVAIPSIGASDCRMWRERGVPAFVFGTTPRNIAAPNESTSIEDFLQVVRVHTLSAFDYLMASR